jgi:undecaprenyl-diphosphatase
MNWFEALVLGLIQGLTEFLPVSSSGHLALANAFFGVKPAESLYFTIVDMEPQFKVHFLFFGLRF